MYQVPVEQVMALTYFETGGILIPPRKVVAEIDVE